MGGELGRLWRAFVEAFNADQPEAWREPPARPLRDVRTHPPSLVGGGPGESPGRSAPAPRRPRRARKVVGESYYQADLDEICGGKTPEGRWRPCEAELVPEPDNPHDPRAVAVFIEGRKVGYLPRGTARRLCDRRRRCPAQIVGGWRRRDGRRVEEGHYGVELDLRATD